MLLNDINAMKLLDNIDEQIDIIMNIKEKYENVKIRGASDKNDVFLEIYEIETTYDYDGGDRDGRGFHNHGLGNTIKNSIAVIEVTDDYELLRIAMENPYQIARESAIRKIADESILIDIVKTKKMIYSDVWFLAIIKLINTGTKIDFKEYIENPPVFKE